MSRCKEAYIRLLADKRIFRSGGYNQKRKSCCFIKKATRRITRKLVRKIAGWMWPNLTFETSILAFTKFFLYNKGGRR